MARLNTCAKEAEKEDNFFVELAISELEYANAISIEDKELKETLTLAAEAVIECATKAVAKAEGERVLALRKRIDASRDNSREWWRKNKHSYVSKRNRCRICNAKIKSKGSGLHGRLLCVNCKEKEDKLKS